MALAAVEPDAVSATDSADQGSTVGAVRFDADAVRQSATSGPDLVGAQLDAEAGQVGFVFDGRLDDEAEPDAAMFFLITDSGDVVRGESFVEVTDNVVVVLFPQNDVQAGQAVSVDAGAITDEQATRALATPSTSADLGLPESLPRGPTRGSPRWSRQGGGRLVAAVRTGPRRP